MRRLAVLISALFVALEMAALPARPGAIKYVQPDGSTLEIVLHGDEWGHWVTDREGRLLDQDAQGFYRLSARSLPRVRRKIAEQGRTLRQRMSAVRRSAAESPDLTHGTHRVLVLLVEFPDRSFSISAPHSTFTSMLDQKGYDLGGATGSVWDFFNDNSRGQYNPEFDVYGPVKLSKNMASYGKNDQETGRDLFPGPELALVEAASLLDDTVDFSRYDEDGDGTVDMILFYYAGYDEAEGGPADAIWSHQWNVQYSSSVQARNTELDGVKLGSYFCTSELQGNSGKVMGGIGSTVHEFSHHLGLPDFYDTDDTENGYTTGLYFFSTMCYGLYNNNSHTPPSFNLEELQLLGWAPEDAVVELPDGDVSLKGVGESGKGYRISTSTEGEYFLLECRDGSRWDAPLPQGLALYHVDKSKRIIQKTYTAADLWNFWRYTNSLNNSGSHPCFYIVPSTEPTSYDFRGGIEGVLFPGSGKVTAFQPIDWEGVPTAQQITGVRYSGGTVSLTARFDAGKSINGLVVDVAGDPLPGVTVRVDAAGPSAVTDQAGAFFIGMDSYEAETEVDVTAEKAGYVSKTLTILLKETGNNLYMMLRKEGEPEITTLDKSDPSAQLMAYSASGNSLMGAVRFTAEELAPYVDQRLSTVTFYPVVYKADAIIVIVESGGQRLLNHVVKNPAYAGWNTVDISEYDLRVPSGEDVYIGYAVRGGDYEHPLSCRLSAREDPTESYYATYSATPVKWTPMKKYDLALSATVSEVQVPTALSDIGFHSIDPGSGTYKAGNTFKLRLKEAHSRKPSSVSWYYDGAPVSESSVQLTAGVHTVEARLSYESGAAEVLEMEIEVK